MNSSNSKLTADQKNELAAFKALNPDVVFVDNGNVTLAYTDDGKIVRFASSIMSTDEVKFRRKVGQYKAAHRFENENIAMLPSDMFQYFMEMESFWTKEQWLSHQNCR